MIVLVDTQDYGYEKESDIHGFIKMQLYVKMQRPHVGLSVLEQPGQHSLSWPASAVASRGCTAWLILLPFCKGDE